MQSALLKLAENGKEPLHVIWLNPKSIWKKKKEIQIKQKEPH